MEKNNRIKYQIAKLIARNCIGIENPTYNQLLEMISENRYRTIDKVPSELFFMGIIESFKNISTLEDYNNRLNLIKEVVIEALETNGIETTFTDEEWLTLAIIENTTSWGRKEFLLNHCSYLNKNNKAYLSAFFEN